jgi:hypothetical protein
LLRILWKIPRKRRERSIVVLREVKKWEQKVGRGWRKESLLDVSYPIMDKLDLEGSDGTIVRHREVQDKLIREH